jgi:hypothetical protein
MARISISVALILAAAGMARAQEPAQTPGSSTAAEQQGAPAPVLTPAPVPVEPVAAPPVPTVAAHPVGQAGSGFLLSANFGFRPIATATGPQGTPLISGNLQGGLALGFKVGRVMLSLGLDLSALDQKSGSQTDRTTTFLLVPGLQIALVRSRDQRVELVGSVRVGAGTTMTSQPAATPMSPPMSPLPVLTMYEIAPAVRFWAHKQFALQGLAGYSGNYIILRGTSSASLGIHSAVASVGALGIF